VSKVPDVLPVLSRGKHRSPRQGACFMELASFLAGERWSDSPSCTHPLLAEVARNVNDRTSDEARPLLAPLIPDVVGLSTDDPRADARIALHCALVALPIAPIERQRALAVAVGACLRLLRTLDDGAPYALELRARRALEQAPEAAAWAERFAERAGARRAPSLKRFRRHSGHDIVKLAGRGIEQGADAGRDDLLRQMLAGAITEVRALVPRPAPAEVDPVQWRAACSLTT
jgi:hypothetical protein